MASTLTSTTQAANRFGMNLKFYEFGAAESAEPVVTIDYANEVSVELTGDLVWATGGQSHANKVPFSNPIEGTLTISTQLMAADLVALIAGQDTFTSTEILFNNNTTPKFYKITGSTVWKDKDGKDYTEDIIIYKASPDRAYNVTYTGDGDPSSMDITFTLTEDDSGNVYSAKRADKE